MVVFDSLSLPEIVRMYRTDTNHFSSPGSFQTLRWLFLNFDILQSVNNHELILICGDSFAS